VTIEARFTASSRSGGSHRDWTDLNRASNSRVEERCGRRCMYRMLLTGPIIWEWTVVKHFLNYRMDRTETWHKKIRFKKNQTFLQSVQKFLLHIADMTELKKYGIRSVLPVPHSFSHPYNSKHSRLIVQVLIKCIIMPRCISVNLYKSSTCQYRSHTFCASQECVYSWKSNTTSLGTELQIRVHGDYILQGLHSIKLMQGFQFVFEWEATLTWKSRRRRSLHVATK
jgi:hypothetical protein